MKKSRFWRRHFSFYSSRNFSEYVSSKHYVQYGRPDEVSAQYGRPDEVSAQYGRPDEVSAQYGRPDKVSVQYGRPDEVSDCVRPNNLSNR